MSKIKKKNDSINTPHYVEKDAPAKSVNWEEYFNYNTFQIAPANHQAKTRFGIDLILYVKENKGCLKISEWLEHVGLDYSTWKRWCAADPEIAKYNTMAKMILGSRREKGAIIKDFDANFIMKSMPLYDPEWKENDEWRAKLTEGSELGGTKIVIMEKFAEKE